MLIRCTLCHNCIWAVLHVVPHDQSLHSNREYGWIRSIQYTDNHSQLQDTENAFFRLRRQRTSLEYELNALHVCMSGKRPWLRQRCL